MCNILDHSISCLIGRSPFGRQPLSRVNCDPSSCQPVSYDGGEGTGQHHFYFFPRLHSFLIPPRSSFFPPSAPNAAAISYGTLGGSYAPSACPSVVLHVLKEVLWASRPPAPRRSLKDHTDRDVTRVDGRSAQPDGIRAAARRVTDGPGGTPGSPAANFTSPSASRPQIFPAE